MSQIISLQNISKSYQVGATRQKILDDISFDVNKSDLLAIMGVSGSGKSTLMNILGLLDIQDAGEYFLDAHYVNKLSEEKRAQFRNKNIGFVFQQFNLLKNFNVLQNIELPLLYANKNIINKSVNFHKVQDVLVKVGLQDYINYLPNQLSGGQQQRVAIARALINNPKIILADEPTGALDSKTANEILRLFLTLQEEGKTIIIVTHDKQVAQSCQKQIHIKDGRITKFYEP